MASLNKVILIGHLTADPELKQSQSGLNVTTFSIGVTRKIDREKTDFITVVAWRQTAEFITRYFLKGDAICICGQIQTRSYAAQDGTKRYVVEVLADEANFVAPKSERNDRAEQPASNPNPNNGFTRSQPSYIPQGYQTTVDQYTEYPASAGNFTPLSDDDDLPF